MKLGQEPLNLECCGADTQVAACVQKGLGLVLVWGLVVFWVCALGTDFESLRQVNGKNTICWLDGRSLTMAGVYYLLVFSPLFCYKLVVTWLLFIWELRNLWPFLRYVFHLCGTIYDTEKHNDNVFCKSVTCMNEVFLGVNTSRPCLRFILFFIMQEGRVE